MSQPTTPESAGQDELVWPALPTETDIYILPDGRVVVADLPRELMPLVEALGFTEPCEVSSTAMTDEALAP